MTMLYTNTNLTLIEPILLDLLVTITPIPLIINPLLPTPTLINPITLEALPDINLLLLLINLEDIKLLLIMETKINLIIMMIEQIT